MTKSTRNRSLRISLALSGPLASGLLASALLAACGGGGGDSGRIRTESVRYAETKTPLAGDDLRVSAPDYVHGLNHDLDLGLSANDEYTVVSVTGPGQDGLRHARLQQTYASVPVVGSEVIAHADDTTFLGFNGYVTKNLSGFDVTTTTSGDQAVAKAEDDFSMSPPVNVSMSGVPTPSGLTYQFSDEATTLVIRPHDGGEGADLAWKVDFKDQSTDGSVVGGWTYFVNAHDGSVITRFSTIQTADVQQGSGDGGNARHPVTWSAQLDVVADPAMADQFKMETERLKTEDQTTGMVVEGPLDALPDSTANDAHGYAEVTLNMLRDWMGRDSIDDKGMAIHSIVHVPSDDGSSLENAYWDGEKMNYGDGGAKFYPLSGALDVVAHEIDHGFTQFHSNLTYAGQSGGLNESFSDIAGTTAEFYKEGEAADFSVGEDVFRSDGALRYMCSPTDDNPYYQDLCKQYTDACGDCDVSDADCKKCKDQADYVCTQVTGSIDNAGDYTDSLNVHFTSGVPNKAFCLAVGRYKAGPAGSSTTDAVRHIAQVWYEANASYWTAGTTYVDACQGTVDAARALGFSGDVVAEIGQSWADVGVTCEAESKVCNGDGTCNGDAGENCASCPDDCGACSESCNGWKKFKCKLGIGDCSLCDKPAGCGDGLCDGDETDSSCPQDCGCSSAGYTCGDNVPAPFGCYCDPLCQQYGDCCADVGTCN